MSWYNRSWHNAQLYNRSRMFRPDQAASDAAHAAEEAAALARRAADDADREYWSHHTARRAKAYRAAVIAARATAEARASPPPEPMAPVVVDPIKVAQAVERLRSLRQPSRPVDPSRAFGGGVWLP